MTKYLDSSPFMVMPPAKEFKPETPTNLYADRFPELVEEPTRNDIGREFIELGGVKYLLFTDKTLPKDEVLLVSGTSGAKLVNVKPEE